MAESQLINPSARKEGILIQELSDEVLVYDLEKHKAHCLNKVAATIWQNCDGKNSISDMAAIVGKEFNQPISEEIVWLALDQLGRARLLEETVPSRAEKPRLSRRDLIRRGGIAAIIAIPVVTSLLAPKALAGVSSCGSPCDLVSNVCITPGCTNCTGLPGAVCQP